MYFCPGVKVNDTLLVAFAEHLAFSIIEIYIRLVQKHQLTDTHTSRCQHINEREIPFLLAAVAHLLQVLIRISVFDAARRLHLVNPTDRALDQVFLVLQPGEEARQNPTYIVNRNAAETVLLLIIRQV